VSKDSVCHVHINDGLKTRNEVKGEKKKIIGSVKSHYNIVGKYDMKKKERKKATIMHRQIAVDEDRKDCFEFRQGMD